MTLENRINSIAKLGSFLTQFGLNLKIDELLAINTKYFDEFNSIINQSQSYNGWFTQENVKNAVAVWGEQLTVPNLKKWCSNYIFENITPKKVGVIMAGNIPLVGFHDFLSVLISGHYLVAKTSKEDSILIKKIAEILIAIEPKFGQQIKFVEKLENFDAVIATGSNNTAVYFESYFGKYPNIIRKNRNSVAVLSGKESKEDLKELGIDIFQYFGLGCRNISKLYVPKKYDFSEFFEAIFPFNTVINNNKYANNYDYNRAVYLLGGNNVLDNNFILLREDKILSSPVAVLHYEYYESISSLTELLSNQQNEIQCIVSQNNLIQNSVPFGKAQSPSLWDYADGVDTLQFLCNLG